MALTGLRNLLKLSPLYGEILSFNARSIALSNLRLNTVNQDSTSKREGTESSAPPPANEAKVDDEIVKLNNEIARLTETNSDLMDRYKRALADGENLRIRLTKQISEAKIFGIQNFCKDLLDVADVLSKATESVPKEELAGNRNPHLKNLYEGVQMTEAQLKSVFKRHGLEPVNPLNEKFDPNFHEALFTQEVEGKDPGTVVIVSKIGYKLHDRVLRPALVGVSK